MTSGRSPGRSQTHPGRAADDSSARHQRMLEVLRQFRIVVRSVRRHYEQVERLSGVSGAQLWALAYVADHPGTKVGELARALAIHPSTASNLVGRLESLGLVVRARMGKDQRTVQLHLTAKGKDALKHAPRPIIGVLQQALSDLPDPSLETLHQLLAELIGAMKVKDTRGEAIPLSDM